MPLDQVPEARLCLIADETDRVIEHFAEEGCLHMPRELIDTGNDKRYVRRDEEGRFKQGDEVGRSLSLDEKRDAKTKSKKGEGDRGDR